MKKITKDVILEMIQTSQIEFSSTHATLCLPIIVRIYKKMASGIKFSPINVKDNLVCDGHHRYIASLLAGLSVETAPGATTSATAVIDWKLVIFEEEEWDTPAKIDMLNEQDANYNNLTIEQIIEILK